MMEPSKLPVGSIVNHPDGHGLGKIVGHNTSGGFYNGERYPYIIEFDSGYKDVYDVDQSNVCVIPSISASTLLQTMQRHFPADATSESKLLMDAVLNLCRSSYEALGVDQSNMANIRQLHAPAQRNEALVSSVIQLYQRMNAGGQLSFCQQLDHCFALWADK